MADIQPTEADPPEIEDIGSNPDPRDTLADLVERRLSRRAALRGLGGAAAPLGDRHRPARRRRHRRLRRSLGRVA